MSGESLPAEVRPTIPEEHAHEAGEPRWASDPGGPRRSCRRRGQGVRRPLRSRGPAALRRLGGVPGLRRRGRHGRGARRRDRRRSPAGVPGSGAAPGLRHRPQLPGPRAGVGRRGTRRPGHVHQVPHLPGRALRRRRAVERHRGLGGRAGGRDRPPGRAGGRVRRLGACRRAGGRPGRVRPDRAVRRGQPVQPGQVVPPLRTDRALAGHARRARRPRRPGARLRRRRRDRAGMPAPAT